MAIGEGKHIAIVFDRPLIGDVTGLTPTPIGGYGYSKINLDTAVATSLNYYSLPPSYAIDGNLATYWRGSTSINWIKIQLPSSKIVTKFRLYMGDYYIRSFTISGSNDDTNWTQIGDTLIGATSTAPQWYEYEIENEESYQYYKIDTLTTYSSSRIYLFEFELYETVPIGNESAFTVTGQEYNYVPEGELQSVEYNILSVISIDTNIIGLEFEDGEGSFINSVGNITVNYAGGNLQGEGGPVTSFEFSFIPINLISKPDQNCISHIEISSLSANDLLLHIYYINCKNKDEHIEITSITVNGMLINVNDL